MTIPFISFSEGEANLTWPGICRALEAGHKMPKAEIGDTFLYRDPDTLLSRSAWIDGMGVAVKSVMVFPGNPGAGKPLIHGAVTLFSDADGTVDAVLDGQLVTKWKTAGDSLYAAMRLARPDSEKILIVGAGTVGRSLYDAYRSQFPNAHFTIWNRTRASAETMAAGCPGMTVADDLQIAVMAADIVTSATMTTEPILRGEWLRPGQHIDLIGAYRPDMREADDHALKRARVFVDSYDTTLDHIGELKSPLQSGAISRDNVLAEFYEPQAFARQSDDEITLFKNGGGAHLDLMTSRYILDAWKGAQ